MKLPTRLPLPVLLLAALLSVLAHSAAALGESKKAPSTSGPDLAGIDKAVVPGADFFGYANGAWRKATDIPADRSSYGTGAMLTELTTQRTADLIQEAAKSTAAAGSETRKIADYYASFMDEDTIEKQGLKPLQPALDSIALIADRKALARALGATLRADVDALNNTNFHTSNLLGLWVAQDLSDPDHYVPFLLQGGLGMPDRDYYVNPSPAMATIRGQYQAHIATVLRLANTPDADGKATRVFELERRIAQVHSTRADSEDVRKANNPWRREEFERRAPGLDWTSYFAAAGLNHSARFILWQPAAITGISALLASEPLDTWKDYLRFHALDRASSVLPKAFVAEQFAFYDKVLSGTPQMQPRWKRAVTATNSAMGEAVGKLYVGRYFPPAEKARVEAMVRNLMAAFGARIDKLEWMAPETKVRAKAKLASLKIGVGYPDKWRNFTALQIVRGDALGNAQRAELFEFHRNLAKLTQQVDRSEWVMTPQTVNAVNLPVMNAMNFPAAELQPPFFDPRNPLAMNYGATGATIGHEISHSFDDQGALFDDSGRLDNWWTPQDFAHFEAAATRLVAQFNGYRPFPDLAVNGKQTLSENIADVAGLSAAYDAYRLAAGTAPAQSVSGFNGDQLFFLSFAQSWRTKMREPLLRQRVIADGHAPAEYRADTVRNLDAWYAAFDVKPGQALYLSPADRVHVW